MTRKLKAYDIYDFGFWLGRLDLEIGKGTTTLGNIKSCLKPLCKYRTVENLSSIGAEAQGQLSSLGRKYKSPQRQIKESDMSALVALLNNWHGRIDKASEAWILNKRSDTEETPSVLFDAMHFHPRVVKAGKQLFKDGHYSDAIFRAFTEICNYVKERSCSNLDGKQLMAWAFNEMAPVIKVSHLISPSNNDEQEGFKFLFMGGQIGIRNPKAHNNIIQKDPFRTLEYLALASLLMKRVQDGQVTAKQLIKAQPK